MSPQKATRTLGYLGAMRAGQRRQRAAPRNCTKLLWHRSRQLQTGPSTLFTDFDPNNWLGASSPHRQGSSRPGNFQLGTMHFTARCTWQQDALLLPGKTFSLLPCKQSPRYRRAPCMSSHHQTWLHSPPAESETGRGEYVDSQLSIWLGKHRGKKYNGVHPYLLQRCETNAKIFHLTRISIYCLHLQFVWDGDIFTHF